MVKRTCDKRKGTKRCATEIADRGDEMAADFGTVGNRKDSWLFQHWAIAGIIALVGACTLAVIFFVSFFSLLRNSNAAQLALHQAESNPIVAASIGTPLKTGWLMSGSVNTHGQEGEAILAIPVIGPKGKGTLYTRAIRRQGQWQTIRLRFVKDGESNSQDLLAIPVEP